MKIEELDEWQGLTAEMVPEWLVANGWQRMPAQDMPRSECWVRNGGAGGTIWVGVDSPADKTLSKIAKWMECSVQALLREINPRMRKGVPSDAALAEHDEWLVCTPSGATFVAEISYGGSDDGFSIMMPPIEYCDAEFVAKKHWPECLFWPCDKHGNKVRWPTDAEGKML